MKKQYWKLGLVALVFTAACGANKEALYTRGPMPAGGDFDGCYTSNFGRMELTVEGGSHVVGLYEQNDKYGRIEGEIKDNLLLFEWTQWDVNMRGKTRETKGRGVFQYMVDESMGGAPQHTLKGVWAYSKETPTNPWNATKLGTKAKKKLVPFDPAKYTGNEEEEEDNSGNFESGQAGGGGEGGGGEGGGSAPSGDEGGGGDANIF